jgi:hypothetical protein
MRSFEPRAMAPPPSPPASIIWVVAAFLLAVVCNAHALNPAAAQIRLRASHRASSARRIVAAGRDFEVGDRVRVCKDVRPAKLDGSSSRGMVGVVISSWSICEEDPVCCCAELATDAPIQVAFEEWTGYFAEARGAKALAALRPRAAIGRLRFHTARRLRSAGNRVLSQECALHHMTSGRDAPTSPARVLCRTSSRCSRRSSISEAELSVGCARAVAAAELLNSEDYLTPEKPASRAELPPPPTTRVSSLRSLS